MEAPHFNIHYQRTNYAGPCICHGTAARIGGAGRGKSSLSFTADDHDVPDLLFHSDQAATEKTEGNSPDVGYLEGGGQRSDLERDSRHGKKLKDDIVVLQIDNNVRIRINRTSISTLKESGKD